MEAYALTPAQRRTLAAICDTLLPQLSAEQEAEMLARRHDLDPEHVKVLCRSSASDLGVPESIEETLAAGHLPTDSRKEFELVLNAMSTRLGMLALCGTATPFASLSHADRERCLMSMRDSMFATKRKVFQTFKAMTGIKALSRDTSRSNPHNNGADKNLLWSAMDFEGPPSAEEALAETEAKGRKEFVYTMLNDSITQDTTLTVDAVIVGSGCGGGVVAAELAAAGLRVLVLEKAQYFKRSEISGSEGDAYHNLYERGCLAATEDTGLAVLAGSAFGGGTAVNWACCLRTPSYVKEEWAAKHGLKAFADGTFDASLDAVCSRIGVTSEGVAHSKNNELLAQACEKLGYPCSVAPQNMADVGPLAPGAHFIGSGDRFGLKQSTPETFLKDAATAVVPASFADRCYVEQVLHKGGVAQGVRCRIVGADGASEHTLIVNAPKVVVSCGSLNSPALLLRSGLANSNRQIGKNLRLHPVSGVVGIMPNDVAIWRGAPMTLVSDVVAKGPVGDNYGAKLECPLLLPGIASSVTPWKDGAAFKDRMLDYKRLFSMIVLTRDKGSGEVRIDKEGTPRLYYKVGEHDLKSLADGVEKALRLVEAAGAESILMAHELTPLPLPPQSDPKARAVELEKIIAQTRQLGFPLYKAPLFSAHQMGTCRMGSDPKTSVVKPTCESWECSGLYVIDASTFPTATGTNPMVTTLGIAHMVAQGLKKGTSSIPSKL